jgi:hypothetical protein
MSRPAPQRRKEALGHGDAGHRHQRRPRSACSGVVPARRPASRPAARRRPPLHAVAGPGPCWPTRRGCRAPARGAAAGRGEGLAQRAGRQQQAVAQAAFVEDDDFDIARSWRCCRPSSATMTSTSGCSACSCARRHAVAAHQHRHAAAAVDQQRFVADLVGRRAGTHGAHTAARRPCPRDTTPGRPAGARAGPARWRSCGVLPAPPTIRLPTTSTGTGLGPAAPPPPAPARQPLQPPYSHDQRPQQQ